MQPNNPPPLCKADQVYCIAHQELACHHLSMAFLCIFRTVLFIVLIPLNMHILDIKDTLFTACLYINLFCSLLGVVVYLSVYFTLFKDTQLYLSMADATSHAVQGQQATDLSSIQACTSQTIYVAQGALREEDLDQQTKKLHIKVTRNIIMEILKASYRHFRCWLIVFDLLSVASLILTIVTLATVDMPVVDTVLLAIYVVIVGLTELFLIIILVFIAFIPLICIGICIYFCCCRREEGAGKSLDLQARAATAQDILNAGGDCSICYQNITQADKVYDLPCSQKHIFHHYCLRQWSKVKNTCPICRQELPMTSEVRESSDVRSRISSHSDMQRREQHVHNVDH